MALKNRKNRDSARLALFWYSDPVRGEKQEETLQQLCRCIRGFISQSIGDSALASVIVSTAVL